ncbi:MAG: hypothetical protein WKF66_01985 [Pedobacter sp.]
MNKILIILLLLSNLCVAQNKGAARETLPDGSTLTYNSLYGNLNGAYTISIENDPILRGSFNNGKRVGNWFFFNRDKSLFMRYNYDLNKLLSIDEKKLALAKTTVLSSDENISKKASVPIPLLSLDQYFALMSEEVKKVIAKGISRNVTRVEAQILAKIDTLGLASYEVVYKIKGKQTTQKFTPLFGTLNIEWIPAIYEGKRYPSEFSYDSELELRQDAEHIKRFYWGPKN